MRGGYGKGAGIPLHERTHGIAHARAMPPVRHVWVLTPSDGSAERRPGLLVQWRQQGSDWLGWVVYPAQLTPGNWSVVQEWMRAELLEPVMPSEAPGG